MKAAGIIVSGTALWGSLSLGMEIAAMNTWLVKAFASGKK
jgi:hypothetical protein